MQVDACDVAVWYAAAMEPMISVVSSRPNVVPPASYRG